MSWGGGDLLGKNGRATADGGTGRARPHEGSRRASCPRAGTSDRAEGSRLSREQTARRLGGLTGAVVPPLRKEAGGGLESWGCRAWPRPAGERG